MKLINIFKKNCEIEKNPWYFLGDKDQEERNKAVQEFKSFVKDVLVATDVASKGLGKCVVPKKFVKLHFTTKKISLKIIFSFL